MHSNHLIRKDLAGIQSHLLHILCCLITVPLFKGVEGKQERKRREDKMKEEAPAGIVRTTFNFQSRGVMGKGGRGVAPIN